MTKVSIIIPVFNCEQSIEQSIQSVQKQTLKEIEIICVDDGSTDDSAEMIRKLQKNDGRIVLYRQKNQGSGAARNLGMRYAKGEFIAFLDADDYYWDANALENMFHVCKEQGVSVCGTNINIERGGKLVPDRGYQEVIEASHNKNILEYRDFQFDYGYYGFIFEKKMLYDGKVQFPLYRRFQDPVFLVRAMEAAEKFCFIDRILYVYRAPNLLSRFHEQSTVDLLCGLLDNLQFAMEYDLKKLFERTMKRMEEEYADIIYRNLSVESLSVLLEINQLIKENTTYSEHTIMPITKVINSVKELQKRNKQTAEAKLFSCEEIFLYGAGQACIDCLQYLGQYNLVKKVKNILVTSLRDNPVEVLGIPLVEIGDYQFMPGDLIIVTVVGSYQNEVIALLEEKGINSYELLNNYIDFKH